MVVFPNLPLPKPGIKLLDTRRLLILYPFYAQIRTSDILMMYFVREPI